MISYPPMTFIFLLVDIPVMGTSCEHAEIRLALVIIYFFVRKKHRGEKEATKDNNNNIKMSRYII